MKKVMLIMMAILGMAWNANAQVCEIAGNVEGHINDRCVTLHNYNSYMVTVTAEITVVNTDGSERKIPKTSVIKGDDSKTIYFLSAHADQERSHVNIISVLKCQTNEYEYIRKICGYKVNMMTWPKDKAMIDSDDYKLYKKDHTYYVTENHFELSYLEVHKNETKDYKGIDVSNYKYLFYDNSGQPVFFNF